jgi:hypothetical protein
MKKISLLIVSLFLFPSISYSNFYDGIWEVTDVVGESWFSLKKRHIGKTQEFWKGYAGGVFFTCNYKGLVTTRDSYTLDEFLNKKEFRLFRKHQNKLDSEGTEVSVTRETCTGNYLASRKEMYPIVNFENWDKAFYLSNGVIFVMEQEL